ncbi:MAG TPA: GNAT family N-acetyltransferase, partial [Propionibacteriaceae bacterium]|nr:GNAT family N-acetyltransferase [Propionibacteriaceae bacterium]
MPEELRLQQVPYEHPDVTALTRAANEFYTQIYGGPDETPFTMAEFTPPNGKFYVGYLNGEAVAMG